MTRTSVFQEDMQLCAATVHIGGQGSLPPCLSWGPCPLLRLLSGELALVLQDS